MIVLGSAEGLEVGQEAKDVLEVAGDQQWKGFVLRGAGHVEHSTWVLGPPLLQNSNLTRQYQLHN